MKANGRTRRRSSDKVEVVLGTDTIVVSGSSYYSEHNVGERERGSTYATISWRRVQDIPVTFNTHNTHTHMYLSSLVSFSRLDTQM